MAAWFKAADPDFTIHTARHPCASRLVQRGVRLEVVKEWCGHQTIQTTLRYAHLRPQNLLDVAHVLEPETAAPSATEAQLLALLRANPDRVRELLATP